MLQQRDYQAQGTAFLKPRGRAILGDDAGLGKTNQLLLAAEGKTLVVAPASLRSVWEEEVALWRPDLDWEFTSYHGLLNGTKGELHPRLCFTWNTVIFDEAHYLKERKTSWTVAAQKLKTERLWLATGTAIPNWAHELYVPLMLMHEKSDHRYKSYWRWLETWFEVNIVTYRKNPKPVREIGGLLPNRTWKEFAAANDVPEFWLRRKRADVLQDLPPLTVQHVHVPMAPDQAKVYKAFKKDNAALIEATGYEVIAWSSGSVWVRLIRLASGVGVEDTAYPVDKGSGKLDAFCEWAHDRIGSPFLVAGFFRNTCELAAARLRAQGHRVALLHGGVTASGRQRAVASFKSGEVDVLVGSIGVMGEGLTLTRAHELAILERDPRPGKVEQVMRRIHRLTQTRPCSVVHFITADSEDADLWELVKEKRTEGLSALRGFDLVTRGR